MLSCTLTEDESKSILTKSSIYNIPLSSNMSVLDDGVVQVPVEALLDIRHILHLSKKLTIRNLKMGGKRNTKCEAKEIQSVRLQKYKILGKINT